MNLAHLWSRAWSLWTKSRTFFCYQTTNLLEIWLLFLVSMKGQRRDKNEFVTKFCRSYSYDHFLIKHSLKFVVKSFLHSVCSPITWNAKPWTKTQKSALSKSSPTICTLVEELSNCHDYFLRLSRFPDLFGKVFLIAFKFS